MQRLSVWIKAALTGKGWDEDNMKKYFYNIGYFIKEAKTIIRVNLLSNITTLLSTALILFILAIVISGWWVSNQVVEAIEKEAEINVYFDESLDNEYVIKLIDKIKNIDGVRSARVVDEGEAYNRMVEILGKEAQVLKYFDDNPFSSFIEVRINLGKMDSISKKLDGQKGVEHIRDNKKALDRLNDISDILKVLGYFVVTAVGITTLVIISHIIRLGIHNSKEQINTMRLLGAPNNFIAFPFLLEGLLLTIGGGILAAALVGLVLKQVYANMAGPLPFIPLPPLGALVKNIIIIVIMISAILGLIGSFIGLSSAIDN